MQEDGRVERRNGIRKVREAKTRGRSSKGAERARDQVVQAHRYRQILKPGSQGAFCRPSVLTSDESCREAQQCLCIVRAGDVCVRCVCVACTCAYTCARPVETGPLFLGYIMDLEFVGLKVVWRDSGNRCGDISSGPSRRVIRGLQGSCTVCPLAKHLHCAATEAGHFIHAEPRRKTADRLRATPWAEEPRNPT